jgi:predicted nucleotidyltransferase
MMFGLQDRDFAEMQRIFDKYPEIEEIIIFGSRAMGNYKKGSDVDLAVKGKNLSGAVIREIEFELNEETQIPYFFDVLQYEALTNEKLRKHIDEFGCRFKH